MSPVRYQAALHTLREASINSWCCQSGSCSLRLLAFGCGGGGALLLGWEWALGAPTVGNLGYTSFTPGHTPPSRPRAAGGSFQRWTLAVGGFRPGWRGLLQALQQVECPWASLWSGGGVVMEGRGRLGFVNSQQNSRIKETGLKGSQSCWPWLQRGQAISCGPGRVAVARFVGLDRLARDPLSHSLETLHFLAQWGQSLLPPSRPHGPRVCVPSQVQPVAEGGSGRQCRWLRRMLLQRRPHRRPQSRPCLRSWQSRGRRRRKAIRGQPWA